MGDASQRKYVFKKQLETLQQHYPNHFQVLYFISNLPNNAENPKEKLGRINAREVISLFKDKINFNSYNFICGPENLYTTITKELLEFGVDETKIISEKYTLVIANAELKDIKTQNITLDLLDGETGLTVLSGKSILEAALDLNIELNYACMTGNCLLCRAKLLKGKIKSFRRTFKNN